VLYSDPMEPSHPPLLSQAGRGWALDSLERSIQRAVLWGTVLYQTVIVVALAGAGTSPLTAWSFVGASVGFAGLALAAERHRSLVPVVPLAAVALVLALYASTDDLDSPVVLAASWQLNLGHAYSSLLILGRRWRVGFTWLFAGAVPVAIALVHPEWTMSVAMPVVVTSLAMRTAGTLVMRNLRELAERIDGEIAVAHEERRRVAAAEAAAAEAAEQARTVHDTVINTLGAVANGIAAEVDPRVVREVCARDLATIDALATGRELVGEADLAELVGGFDLDVERHIGAGSAEALGGLPAPRRRALLSGVREALRNVAKHAGTGRARLVVRTEADRLLVTVVDHGVGFDAQPVAGRGLAESILARSASAGIAVAVRAEPGHGTEVRFDCPLAVAGRADEAVEDDAPEDLVATTTALMRRTSLLYGGAVAAVGAAIAVGNRFAGSPADLVMVAVIGLVVWAAWAGSRGRTGLPLSVEVLAVASVPVIHLLALAAIDFGHDRVIEWQAIGVSAPLIVLLVVSRRRLALPLALLALVATSAVALAAADTPAVAAVLLVGTAPPVCLLIGWRVFGRALDLLARRAAADQAAVVVARLEFDVRHAADAVRDRWRSGALDVSRSLLARLASGEVTYDDAEVRAASAVEEAYLRQLTLIGPELIHLGTELVRVLLLARARGVDLVVRTGDVDVDGDVEARGLADLLAAAVAAVPGGATVTATLFPSRSQLTFGIVADRRALAAARSGRQPPPGWSVTVEEHGEAAIVEVRRDDRPRRPAPAATPVAIRDDGLVDDGTAVGS